MTNTAAKERMLNLLKKYRGKTIWFDSLDEEERYAFVLIKSFEYFGFLPKADRLKRAIDNAEAQRRCRFVPWQGSSMVIPVD